LAPKTLNSKAGTAAYSKNRLSRKGEALGADTPSVEACRHGIPERTEGSGSVWNPAW